MASEGNHRPGGAGPLARIGPGLLIAATGVGAGDLATAGLAGSRLGTAVLWAVVLGAAFKYVVTEGLARYQLGAGQTILEGVCRRFGRPVQAVFLVYLVAFTFVVGGALMSACGVVTQAILPVFDDPATGKWVYGLTLSAAALALALRGGFLLFERVMSLAVGLMFGAVVVVAIMVAPDLGDVARGLLVPTIPSADGAGLGWTVALIGGVGGTLTILCYAYWIREAGRTGVAQVPLCRLDLAVAYAVTALFGLAMIVIASGVPAEARGAGLIVELAERLDEGVGRVGRWVFLAGAWCAVFTSMLGVWQAVPYLFADFVSIARGRHTDPADLPRTRAYRGYLLFLATVPAVGLFTTFATIQKAYAVFGAFFLPLLAAALLAMNHRRRGQTEAWRNGPLATGALWLTLAFFAVFAATDVARRLGFG